jgi:hydroxyethylthiazole kinase-like uncharacterized protein yjeF
MKVVKFTEKNLKKLWQPNLGAGKFSGGQITIVGGSQLFHGAPIFALKAASRVVDMVYFATPESDRGVAQALKASLSSFIWIPFEDLESYIDKSDVVVIGPGMMRYHKETGHNGAVCDSEGKKTREFTLSLFRRFPAKQWVVDGGSLQVVEPELIPKGAVITPNRREYQMLFQTELDFTDLTAVAESVADSAGKYGLVVVAKGATAMVSDGITTYLVDGGDVGLIKGGTGDVLAGLTGALAVRNEPLLAAAAANYLVKKASESLAEKRGTMYNADDVVDQVPLEYGKCISSD